MIAIENYSLVRNLGRVSFTDIPKGTNLSYLNKSNANRVHMDMVSAMKSTVAKLDRMGIFLGISLEIDETKLFHVDTIYMNYRSDICQMQSRVDLKKSLHYWNLFSRVVGGNAETRDFVVYSSYWKLCLAYLLRGVEPELSEMLIGGEI